MDSSEIFITGFGTGMFTGVISAYAIELMTWLISHLWHRWQRLHYPAVNIYQRVAELLPFFVRY